jgi:hypothetical protein
MEPSKIVMRFADGRVLKGYTEDFFADSPTFHFYEKHPKFSSDPTEVLMEGLKGIFFVRDFQGNPKSREPKKIPEGMKLIGRKIEVTFKDKEVMVGSTLDYNPQRNGFFLFPINRHSNNIMIFVVSQAVLNVRFF